MSDEREEEYPTWNMGRLMRKALEDRYPLTAEQRREIIQVQYEIATNRDLPKREITRAALACFEADKINLSEQRSDSGTTIVNNVTAAAMTPAQVAREMMQDEEWIEYHRQLATQRARGQRIDARAVGGNGQPGPMDNGRPFESDRPGTNGDSSRGE